MNTLFFSTSSVPYNPLSHGLRTKEQMELQAALVAVNAPIISQGINHPRLCRRVTKLTRYETKENYVIQAVSKTQLLGKQPNGHLSYPGGTDFSPMHFMMSPGFDPIIMIGDKKISGVALTVMSDQLAEQLKNEISDSGAQHNFDEQRRMYREFYRNIYYTPYQGALSNIQLNITFSTRAYLNDHLIGVGPGSTPFASLVAAALERRKVGNPDSEWQLISELEQLCQKIHEENSYIHRENDPSPGEVFELCYRANEGGTGMRWAVSQNSKLTSSISKFWHVHFASIEHNEAPVDSVERRVVHRSEKYEVSIPKYAGKTLCLKLKNAQFFLNQQFIHRLNDWAVRMQRHFTSSDGLQSLGIATRVVPTNGGAFELQFQLRCNPTTVSSPLGYNPIVFGFAEEAGIWTMGVDGSDIELDEEHREGFIQALNDFAATPEQEEYCKETLTETVENFLQHNRVLS
ncbi:hypothetical protein JYU14_00895 [Simkania negevensis]|uniref:Uncharacterized protein n=1 Tax=Simkania negevensis TaxID=83561 RepID=A0ABS3AR94_9BACT|nr:hypothetical protein [Simkania negevensis]